MSNFERKYRHPKKDYRRLYDVYRGMIRRCFNVNQKQYKDYGGRGITVCDEWLETFDNFADWALESGYAEGLTLDRVDNDGDYEPGNCRWATRQEQCRNKRNNLLITYRGETKCLRSWCDELALPYDQMRNRIVNYGWSPERAFEERIHCFDESIMHDAKAHGLNPRLVYDRIRLGWDYEKAINTPVGAVDVTTDEYKKEHYGYAKCSVCGEVFLKQNLRMKYCGKECSRVAQNALRRRARTA